MTHLNGGEVAQRRLGALRADHSALKAEARRLVEGTMYSQQAIAEQLRVSPSTISTWKHDGGWQRPEGAPATPSLGSPAGTKTDVDGARRERLIARLFRVFDRQLMDVEARAAEAAGTTEEKDARTLGMLARTLGTLIALEEGPRDGGAPADEPERYDPDEIRARLAQRLAGFSEDEEG